MDAIKTEMEKREILRLNNAESNKLTRECLSMALVYLMNEKPFDKITITELVKRSGVSRTAFYRNYTTKEDILHEIGNELVETIGGLLEKQEYRNDPYKWYLECFHLVQENSNIIQLMINAQISFENLFQNGSIIEYMYPSDTYIEKYKKIAAEAAFHKMLLVWFEDGMKEAPEDMARLCSEIFSGNRRVIS